MLTGSENLVNNIHSHLCSKGLFGKVTEWCEMRNDCVFVVTCPDCGEAFALDEDEYEMLLRRSHDAGDACGITPFAD